MLKFLLMISGEGHVKFAHYFVHFPLEKRHAAEARIVRLCLNRDKDSCHFIEDGDQMIIFRWFGPYLLAATTDPDENELLVYEFLHLFVSILSKYFGNFSERHILFHVDRLHMVLEELVVDGEIVESSSKNALGPILLLDSVTTNK